MTNTTAAKTWEKLSDVDKGRGEPPGGYYTTARATVEKKGSRYRVTVKTDRGSNQGYRESHVNGGDERQYRADSLAELMRIAIAAEKWRDEPDEDILTAIREAIYRAEDAA